MAETLIPLEEREEERRPSRVEPPRRSGGWVGKLALVLAVVALAVACLALYRTLPPGEDDPQEPGERAESPTISYRDRELPVLEGVAVNSYVSDGFSVNDRGWLTYEQDGKQAAIGISGGDRLAAGSGFGSGICHDPAGVPGILPGGHHAGQEF